MPVKKRTFKESASDLPIKKDADIERLRKNIYLSDMEKLRFFTKMLRRNALYKKATVTHK